MYRGWIILTAFLSLLAPALSAAQVDLRFDPPDTTIDVGGTCRMSIMLDQVVEVRTIVVHVALDTTVVRLTGGGAGFLYTSSGINTFKGIKQDSLGNWEGYAILIGADLFIEGPGELFYWEFEGLADGVSPIIATEIYLSTTDGSWFPEVNLPATTVTVGDDISSVEEIQPLNTGLNLWPNPFNPRVHVGFDLVATDWIRLEVCDVRGRRVAVLHDGTAPAGPFQASWNGRNDAGHTQPGGVYLFRLRDSRGVATARGVLLKKPLISPGIPSGPGSCYIVPFTSTLWQEHHAVHHPWRDPRRDRRQGIPPRFRGLERGHRGRHGPGRGYRPVVRGPLAPHCLPSRLPGRTRARAHDPGALQGDRLFASEDL